MATVNSNAIGKSSGSAGVLTYRTLRGRTIVSARIVSNNSRTERQVRHRAGFTEVQRLGKALKRVIEVGFDKTAFGSANNNFFKQNRAYLEYVREKGGMEKHSAPLYNLWEALRDKQIKGIVVAALGEEEVTATFRWDDKGAPVAEVTHYQDFQVGDSVTFAFGVTGLFYSKRVSRVVMVEKVLAETDIAGLANKQLGVFDKDSCPELDFRGLLSEGMEDICVVAAAIVTAPNGGRSTSYFSAMAVCPVVCTVSEHRYLDGGKMEVMFASAEVFPAALSRDAIGASLCFPGLTGSQSYVVTDFVKDGQGQPIGLVVEDQIGHDYSIEPLGGDSEPCSLSKDGQVIALIGGLKTPELMA